MIESPEAPEPARTEFAPRPRGLVRRGVFEFLGLSRISRLAMYGIDRKLERHLSFDGNYFVEARFRDEIDRRLNPYYDAVDELTHHDVLSRWKDR